MLGFSRFAVRRGRLKATYTGDLAQFMLQIDAVPTGVTLKDAEATLDPRHEAETIPLTLGQMKWPFGYEAPCSPPASASFPSAAPSSALPPRRAKPRARSTAPGLASCAGLAGVFDYDGSINHPGSTGCGQRQGEGRHRPCRVPLRWISGAISAPVRPHHGQEPHRGLPPRPMSAAASARTCRCTWTSCSSATRPPRAKYIHGQDVREPNGVELLDPPRGQRLVPALLVQNIGLDECRSSPRPPHLRPGPPASRTAVAAPGTDSPRRPPTPSAGTLGATRHPLLRRET